MSCLASACCPGPTQRAQDCPAPVTVVQIEVSGKTFVWGCTFALVVGRQKKVYPIDRRPGLLGLVLSVLPMPSKQKTGNTS